VAFDAANQLNTPLLNVESLFPAVAQCRSCSIPADWSSPLTCQWIRGISTAHAEAPMLLLAELVSAWLATFLTGDSQIIVPTKRLLENRTNLRQKIERCVPAAKTSNIEALAMFECCRWASMILLAVDKMGIPIHVAARHVRIQPRLVRRLRMTDLSTLWGSHKGLLFWVTATCYFATARQCFPLLCTTILAPFTQAMAMSDCCSEIVIKPLRRLKTFEGLCCDLGTPNQIDQDYFL
jgi:hypothetical protein